MEACCSRFTAAEGGARLAAAAAERNTLAVEYSAFVSTRLLHEQAYKIRGLLSAGYQRSAYVTRASRVAYVAYELHILTDLTAVKALEYGDVEDWACELEEKQVVVCTSRVLKCLLEEGLLTIPKLNVLIIDSCHLIFEDENLQYIMKCYKQCEKSEQPRILALTYPLFTSGKDDLVIDEDSSNDKQQDINKSKKTANDSQTGNSFSNKQIKTDGTDNAISEVAIEHYESKSKQIVTETSAITNEVNKLSEESDFEGNVGIEGMRIVEVTEENESVLQSIINGRQGKNTSEQEEIGTANDDNTGYTDTSGEHSCRIAVKDTDVEKDVNNDVDETNYERKDEVEKDSPEELKNIKKDKEGEKEINRDIESVKDDVLSENLDDFELYEKLEWKIEELEEALCCKMDFAEDIDGGKRLANTVAKPKEILIEYSPRAPPGMEYEDCAGLERSMREAVVSAVAFLDDHRYDPSEIYGDELYEEFMSIPDPTIEPKLMFSQFIYVLDQMGPYAADKAAFSLLVKLEKLKIKVPYERHFLLLCLCTTVFVKIRCMADAIFSKYDDWDRIRLFSTPKVMRFAEVLEQFQTPEQRDRAVFVNERNKEVIEIRVSDNQTQNEKHSIEKKDEKETQCNSLNNDNDSVLIKENEVIEGKDAALNSQTADYKLNAEPELDHSSDTSKGNLVRSKTMELLNEIENCDFVSLSNKIEDRVNTYEANLKDLDDIVDDNFKVKDTCSIFKNEGNTTDCAIIDSECRPKEFVKEETDSEKTVNENLKSNKDVQNIMNALSHNEGKTIDNTYIESNNGKTSISNENTVVGQDIVSNDCNITSTNVNEPNINDIVARENTSKTAAEVNAEGLTGAIPRPLDLRRVGPRRAHRARGRGRAHRSHAARAQQMQLNPDALCGVVFVKDALLAKIMFMIIVDMSRCRASLSHLCAQYCAVDSEADGTRPQGKKHEDVLKKFRMHECNLLLATAALEEGIDLPRCNLVVRWDSPPSYRSHGLCRSRARAPRSTVALMAQAGPHSAGLLDHLSVYKEMDQVISRKCGCGIQNEPPALEEAHADMFTPIVKAYAPNDANEAIKSVKDEEISVSADGSVQISDNIEVVSIGNVKAANNANAIKTVDDEKIAICTDSAVQIVDLEVLSTDVQKNMAETDNAKDVDTKVNYRLIDAANKSRVVKVEENGCVNVELNFIDSISESNIKRTFEMSNDECNDKGIVDSEIIDEAKDLKHIEQTNEIEQIVEFNRELNKALNEDLNDVNKHNSNKRTNIPIEVDETGLVSEKDFNVTYNLTKSVCDCKSGTCKCKIKSDVKNKGDKKTEEGLCSVDLSTAIALINRYCGKLPSDTFTRLAPQYWMEEVHLPDRSGHLVPAFVCTLRLPLNCPVKYNIVGHPMPTRVLARRMVALQACRILHKSGELDNQLMPIGKENFKAAELESGGQSDGEATDAARPGTTKRRQYYYKRTASAFTNCQPIVDSSDAEVETPWAEAEDGYKARFEPDAVRNMLYALSSRLWCALPERYNTRGRRLHAPQHAPHAVAVLMAARDHNGLQIPTFPVYTRSGEVRVSIEPAPRADVRLSPRRAKLVRRFMRFVFADVLRVRRRGMRLQTEGSTHNNYYIVPTVRVTGDDGVSHIDIDWSFLEVIYKHTEEKKNTVEKPVLLQRDEEEYEVEEAEKKAGSKPRENDGAVKKMENPLLKPGEVFVFDAERYRDAVVTPWYRNRDQPQYFLVAEICWNLTPDSAFPSGARGSFRDYYAGKYGVELTQPRQPLLDVDHTSARLNLLTPRYVNRKGVALPVSSERTRRAKRDRLDQKQILVPELCAVHPFAAPLWFATVALPCVLYRINALLIADEIRRAVAADVALGVVHVRGAPPPQWPPLDFGWSLAEVLNNDEKGEKSEKKKDEEDGKSEMDSMHKEDVIKEEEGVTEVKEKTINDILQEKEDAETGFEIGTWSNDMASSIPQPEYDEFLEPLPPNLTFCTSASGGANWSDPIEKPKSSFGPSKAFSMAESDCSYMSSDFDTDDSDLNSEMSDEETESSGFCSKNSYAAMGVRIEYKTAHEAEAVDVERKSNAHGGPQCEPRDDARDAAAQRRLLRARRPPPRYIEKYRKSVAKHKKDIQTSNFITKDKPITEILPDTAREMERLRERLRLNFDENCRFEDKITEEKGIEVNKKEKDNLKETLTTIIDGHDSEMTIKESKDGEINSNYNFRESVDTNKDRNVEEQSFNKSNSEKVLIDRSTTEVNNVHKEDSLNLNEQTNNVTNDSNLHSELKQNNDLCTTTSKSENINSEPTDDIELNFNNKKSNLLANSSTETPVYSSDKSTIIKKRLLEEIFPYKGLDFNDSQVTLENIEKNKRILLANLKNRLSQEEIRKLNCFSMRDIDIDSPEYVNEKVANVGFDTKESYIDKVNGFRNPKEFTPYYQDNKGQSGKQFDFDYQPNLEGHPGPSPSVILQALTMSNANDGINLERLETIGDSFLKFAITAYLYCAHPAVHEGKLSHMRSKQVSNLNLYRLGRNKRLGARMIASKFEPHDNWLPPCHRPPPSHHPASGDQEIQMQKDAALDNAGCFIPYNLITQHSIPDKSIADCVEALIGAYLLEMGPRGALLFMSWLGISVLPRHSLPLPPDHPYVASASCDQKPPPPPSPRHTYSPSECSSSSEECSSGEEEGGEEPETGGECGWSWRGRCVGSLRPRRDASGRWGQTVYGELRAPPSPLLRFVEDPEGELERMLSGYDALERTLQYRFRDRSLLLQALTHASHQQNRLTDCYQRLEFLGDAILDYLITRHLYEDARRHSPGALTDLRSALVNNTIFATLAARHGFHKYFRHMSPGLNEVLTKYVKIQEENGHSISEEHYLIQEDEMEQAEDVEVPKALGDLFESVAGAIFLDSGMCLGPVWASYVRLMGAELEAFSAAAPKSPVRELLEAEPDTAKFGKPERLADGRRVRVCVEVFGRGAFKGVGRNYRIAKGTAARCALRHLRADRGQGPRR